MADWPAADRHVWVVGSDPACDLPVDRPEVSRRHCRLTHTADGAWIVEDLGSTNGTYLHGTRLTEPTRLARGTAVTLGQIIPMPWPRLPEDRILRIGRDPSNDLVIDAPGVSGVHARLVGAPGAWRVEDLGSTNGTFLNTFDRRITRATPVGPADTLYLGSYALPLRGILENAHATTTPAPPGSKREPKVPSPLPPVPTSTPPQGPSLTAPAVGQRLVIGRDADCDCVLEPPTISGRHARLWWSGGRLYLEDLGSANGTFVNGERLARRPVIVRPGDALRLGSHEVRLVSPSIASMPADPQQIHVEARDIRFDVGDKTLLDGISLSIEPGQLVGLMGPSGAGKTTLLQTLNGYAAPSQGKVLLNGEDLYHDYNRVRGLIGYVPQEDILHRELTVAQALRYTARLRLPPDTTDEAIEARVQEVLAQLGLTDVQNVPIGTPSRGNISGGQRKRVNLAGELLTDPWLLLLDEPTSGLSSEDTLQVLRLLRQQADRGKTVLLTIHQPSLEAFRLLDGLAVLARDPSGPGRLAYMGPAYPQAISYFNPDARATREPSPDEILKGLAGNTARHWADRLRARRSEPPTGTTPEPGPWELPTPPRQAGAVSQWWTLVERVLAIRLKDRLNTAILLLQAPLIALLVVLIFRHQAGAAVTPESWPEVAKGVASTAFVLGLAAVWLGCTNTIREIVGEWSVYRRERMVGLKLAPYVASKLVVYGGLALFQAAVLLVLVRWGIGLKGPFWPIFGLLALAAMVGVGVGLCTSALARTSELAITLLPLLILPMLLLGGALQPRHKLAAPMRVMADVMPSRWAFEGLLLQEAARQPTWEPPGAALRGVPAARDMAETHFPMSDHDGWHRSGVPAATTALIASLVAVVALTLLLLRARDIH